MKTKQIITLIAILFLGILIGKFAFKNTDSSKNKPQDEILKKHWTCSMHPQIDMPEFGACPICGMDLTPKDNSDDTSLANNAFKMSKNAIALANIETVIIGKKTTQNTSTNTILKLSGKIQANDKASSMQTAHFGGRLEHLIFKSIGEYVSKGSLIAAVYSPELVTTQNEFIEVLAIKNTQPQLYKAVKNKLKNWKISEKQIQQIERNKKAITNFKMYANVSGYISEILVQEGSHVMEGTPLFKVSNLGSVWAVFDVYENDIRKLKIGQTIAIKMNAYPDKVITSKINYIDPILNNSTRTIAVRATLNNRNKKLKPGMLLNSEVLLSKIVSNPSDKELSNFEVPKTAVMWTGKRSIVYIKPNKNDTTFELREVTLGNESATNYVILSGLENGDEVIVNGTFTIDAAAQLQGKSSMMNNRNRQESKNKKQEENKVTKRIKVNATFKKQLNVIFHDYMKMKNALVISDYRKAGYNAEKMLLDLKKIKMSLLKKSEAHDVWMASSKKIKLALQGISKENDIEKQRAAFINLSNAMITVISSFGTGKQEIYVEHCPMANDNKGADWLSLDKAIKNPYFGAKMLQCGSIKRTIIN